MSEPSIKSKEMNQALDDFAKMYFNRSRVDSIACNVCVTCGKEANVFKDELSKEEYKISGMCQECQDSVWGSNSEGC